MYLLSHLPAIFVNKFSSYDHAAMNLKKNINQYVNNINDQMWTNLSEPSKHKTLNPLKPGRFPLCVADLPEKIILLFTVCFDVKQKGKLVLLVMHLQICDVMSVDIQDVLNYVTYILADWGGSGK